MRKIHINNSTTIDLDKLIHTRLLIQANSGGGKSWLIRRLLEQSHGMVQQIVIDLEGEFSTLREKHDYIYVAASKEGDIRLDIRSAPLLARKLLELQVSAIIDLSELPQYDRKRFVRLFLDSMIDAPKELWHECLVIIDEAHQFCPEKGQAESAEAVKDLMTRGRKRGFCGVLATQRLSKLHKDAAAECNNKLIGRTGLDVDMKRGSEELGFTSKEQMLSLRNLDAGEFYVFGTAISNEVKRVKVGGVHTAHPQAGNVKIKQTAPTPAIKKILKQLTDLPQEAEIELKTIEDLKTELKRVKGENRDALKTQPSKQAIDQAVTQAVEKQKQYYDGVISNIMSGVKEWQERMDRASQHAVNVMKELHDRVDIRAPKIKSTPVKKDRQPQHIVVKPIATAMTVKAGGGVTVRSIEETNIDRLSNPEIKILDALAWFESIGQDTTTKGALALLTGYSVTSGGYGNLLGKLRAKELIDYPTPGLVSMTDAGRQHASAPDMPLTTEELQRQIFDKIPNPQKRLLQELLTVYPEPLSNEELALRTGYSPTSGGFGNLKGKMRTLGLVTYPAPGLVCASDILFVS